MTALTSDTLTNVVPALIAAQKQFKPAVKDSINPAFRSKYVSLDAVLEAVSEALIVNGLALLQQTDTDDAGTVLITRLIHTSGEWVASRYPVKPVKADPQGEGSALTYARRYSLMALVGIAPEDDDGNAASARPKQESKPAQPVQLDENLFNELMTAITDAPDVAALNRAGGLVAKAEMPSDAKAALRSAFTTKMADIKAGKP